MKMPQAVREVIGKSRVAYVASADGKGRPHLAVSTLIKVVDAEHVAFTAWYCPQTTENLARNRQVSVAVWHPETDHGYQLVGEVSGTTVTAVVNGWGNKEIEERTVPQEERKLTIKINAILELKSGAHSDESL